MTISVYAFADSPIVDTPLDVDGVDHLAVLDSALKPGWGRSVSRADALALATSHDAQVFKGVVVIDVLAVSDTAGARSAAVALGIDWLTVSDDQVAYFLWFATAQEALQAQDASADNMVVGFWKDSDQDGNLWGLDTTPGRP